MEGEIGDDDNKIGGGDNNKDESIQKSILTPGGSYLDDYATGLVEVNRCIILYQMKHTQKINEGN